MGSEFIIRLPLSAKSFEESIEEFEASGPSLRQRVLVVDDNQDAADSLAMLLQLMGSDVQTANDGMSALKAFDTFRPSLVLLDLGMPDITGYEVAKRMRCMPQFHGVRLVALTGWGQEEDRQRTLEAGFHHHLVKPVDIEDLQGLLAVGE